MRLRQIRRKKCLFLFWNRVRCGKLFDFTTRSVKSFFPRVRAAGVYRHSDGQNVSQGARKTRQNDTVRRRPERRRTGLADSIMSLAVRPGYQSAAKAAVQVSPRFILGARACVASGDSPHIGVALQRRRHSGPRDGVTSLADGSSQPVCD